MDHGGTLDVFFSYSHKDKALCADLREHLSALRREGKIRTWWDREIPAGADWRAEIDRNLETADVVLLLISSSFIESQFCYENELQRALERDKGRRKNNSGFQAGRSV